MPAGNFRAKRKPKSPITNRPRIKKPANTNRTPRGPMKFAPRVIENPNFLPKWEDPVPKSQRTPRSLYWPRFKLLFRPLFGHADIWIGMFLQQNVADQTFTSDDMGYVNPRTKRYREGSHGYTKRPNIWIPDIDISYMSAPRASGHRSVGHRGAEYYKSPIGDLILPNQQELSLPKFLPLVELEMSYESPLLAVEAPMDYPGMYSGDPNFEKRFKTETQSSKFRPQLSVHRYRSPSISYDQINQVVDLQTNSLSWLDFYVQPQAVSLFAPQPPSGDYSKTVYEMVWTEQTFGWGDYEYSYGYYTIESYTIFDEVSYNLDWALYEAAAQMYYDQLEFQAAHELHAQTEAVEQYDQLILDVKQKNANFEFVISTQKHNFARSSDPTQPYKRNDSKADSAGRSIYNRFLRGLNLTYGTIDESREMFMAFANNITDIDGGRLHASPFYRAAKYMKGEAKLNMMGFAMDVIRNQVEDQVLGAMGRAKRTASLGLNQNVGAFKFTTQIVKDLQPTAADFVNKMGSKNRARYINRYVHGVDFQRKSSWSDLNAPFLSPDFVDFFQRVRYDSVRRDRDTSDEGSDPID